MHTYPHKIETRGEVITIHLYFYLGLLGDVRSAAIAVGTG